MLILLSVLRFGKNKIHRLDRGLDSSARLTIQGISSTVMNMFLKLLAYAIMAVVIYLILRFFSALNSGQKRMAPGQKTSGVMVKDETCDTYLPKDEAIRELYQGQEHFFCSNTCRKKFLQTKKPH
ncbi:MAG: hypothetical protein ACERK6_03130 [Candidatus Aminicenantaceae bacterium]